MQKLLDVLSTSGTGWSQTNPVWRDAGGGIDVTSPLPAHNSLRQHLKEPNKIPISNKRRCKKGTLGMRVSRGVLGRSNTFAMKEVQYIPCPDGLRHTLTNVTRSLLGVTMQPPIH